MGGRANLHGMSTPFAQDWDRLRAELSKAIVGHEDIIDGVLTSLFAGGHVLLEGVPGLGKTLLVRSLSQALSLDFSRIQFTPDLLPADITGTEIFRPRDGTFHFQPGPIFRTWYSPTKSTGHLRRFNLSCSKPWKSVK